MWTITTDDGDERDDHDESGDDDNLKWNVYRVKLIYHSFNLLIENFR